MTLGVRIMEPKAGWSKLSDEFYFGVQSHYTIYNLIALDGSATVKLSHLYLPEQAAGGISIGGTSPATVIISYIPWSTIHLLPSFQWRFATAYFWRGGVILGFNADGKPTWGASYDWNTTWRARGFIKICGISRSSSGRGLTASGGIRVSGTAIVKWGTSYKPISEISISGSSPPTYVTYSTIMGGIIIGVFANSIYFTSLSYQILGTIYIAGSGDYGFRKISVMPTGSIKISGTIIVTYRTFFVVMGSIIIGVFADSDYGISRAILEGIGKCSLGSTTRYNWRTHYVGSNIIKLSGAVVYHFGTRCIPTGRIKISGISKLAWGTSYASLVSIIRIIAISQYSSLEIYVIWDAFTGPIISGTSPVQWGSHYTFFGGVIVGVYANAAYGIFDVKIYGLGGLHSSGRALYGLRLSCMPTWKIIVGRYANTDHGIKYIHVYSKGGLLLSGIVRSNWRISRLVNGFIKIGKFTNVDAGFKHVIWKPFGGIKLSNTARIASQFFYIASGLFVLRIRSTTRCTLCLTPICGRPRGSKRCNGKHKASWGADADKQHKHDDFESGRPNPYETGFVIGDWCYTDHGFTKIELFCSGGIKVHEPRILGQSYFPIYDTYFPHIPYTVVHRPRRWDGKYGDIRVNGKLTPSMAMWWKFTDGAICYVEWQAKMGNLYRVSIKKRQINWESGQPVKVYEDTFNEIYLENELLTREEALAIIETTKPELVPTKQEFSMSFNDGNSATAQITNMSVSVRFIIRHGMNITKLAQHYATITCLHAAGLENGTVKGLRMTQNRSSGSWADVLFAFTQVWTNPPHEMPDRGNPRKWSQG